MGNSMTPRRCIGEAMTAMEATCQRKLDRGRTQPAAGEIVLLEAQLNPARAEAFFQRALAVARQQQAKSWELRAAMSLARLWRDQGKSQQARELLAPALTASFTEVSATRDPKEAKALLDELA